ncbi:MAG: hypothetical protein QGF59_09650, partial [Pirellulaceae bacterium]|nr:hypothetical protein [Pirellulaceae bacterium]
MNVLLRFLSVVAVVLTSVTVTTAPLSAQTAYPAYQTVYRTVYEPESVVAYRLEYETLLEDRQ